MSESTQRAAIYEIIHGVTNVGNVYDYERWAAFAAGQLDVAKYRTGGRDVLRFWTIRCESIAQDVIDFAGDIKRAYTYVISGGFGLEDTGDSETTSETLAIEIVEDVMEALDASADLHTSTDLTDGINTASQLRVFELRLIGSELCHYAEISQTVTELT